MINILKNEELVRPLKWCDELVLGLAPAHWFLLPGQLHLIATHSAARHGGITSSRPWCIGGTSLIRQQHVLVSRGGVLADTAAAHSCIAGKGGGSFGARTWPSFGSDAPIDLIQLYHLFNGSAAVFCTICSLSWHFSCDVAESSEHVAVQVSVVHIHGLACLVVLAFPYCIGFCYSAAAWLILRYLGRFTSTWTMVIYFGNAERNFRL